VGCRAITPAMASLAKRLEGKPFHLIASFCQQGTRDEIVAYAQSQGITADNPNLTITKQGRHPDVKGNGHVPYYMVFDHTGTLVREHMCGAYHGGDGNAFIEWVDKMMAKAPAIYLGDEPYAQASAQATAISARKKMSGALAKVAEGAAGGDAALKAECDRITEWVARWRAAQLKHADRLLAKDPAQVVPFLEALSKDLKGHALAADVDAKLQELDGSKDLKAAIKIAKSWAKYRALLAKQKCCESCKKAGLQKFRVGCSACSGRLAAIVKGISKKLSKAVDGKEHLPITPAVLAWLQQLES